MTSMIPQSEAVAGVGGSVTDSALDPSLHRMSTSVGEPVQPELAQFSSLCGAPSVRRTRLFAHC